MSAEQSVLVFAQRPAARHHLLEVLDALRVPIIAAATSKDAERMVESPGTVLLVAQAAFEAPGEAGLFLRARMQRPPVASIAVAERCDADVVDFAARVGACALLSAPADAHTLRDKARAVLDLARFAHGLPGLRESLRQWESDLAGLEEAAHQVGAVEGIRPAHALLTLLTRHLARTVRQVTDLAWACAEDRELPLCEVAACPQVRDLSGAIREAVTVLEETKKSFRSKQLAQLRARLQEVLDGLG